MKCCFAGIYRGSIPLVTHSTEDGMWDRIFLNMCENGKVKQGIQLLNTNGYLMGILRDVDDLSFMIVTKDIDDKTAEDHLQRLKSEFIRANLNWRTAEQLSLMSVYEGKLTDFMTRVTRQAKVSKIETNVSGTMDEMKEQYYELFQRQCNLEHINQLAEELDSHSGLYENNAVKLKRKLCWERYRWYVIGGSITLIVFLIIIIVSCGGFNLQPRCIKPAATPAPTTPPVDPA
ncbi:Synaptobrevin family protein [Trichomonas vaginalis G3]|uniref:Synaptobrevin family protein n=1 Tax=Trichomonas vaginalis (strain ATCC PRA-98 / G3) TaxID=412133 RepID=A2FX43_TRIV3|nr:synaptobrevin family [Trichomonas vaginalis G3]EAX90521.1 Synaptobrevin family protein [Trichomonas vaginalis G3]KAI5483771.1 synaptobrevin family [Trichomonas vaginalis G3]|eukprot:XP_001303451.1 Synaptobrevin family protein [Trichomonas vaginalis G3]